MTDDIQGYARFAEELGRCTECGGFELPEALSDCSKIAPFAGRCCFECAAKLADEYEPTEAHAVHGGGGFGAAGQGGGDDERPAARPNIPAGLVLLIGTGLAVLAHCFGLAAEALRAGAIACLDVGERM